MLDATPWRFGRALLCFLLLSTANAMKRREADGSPFDPLVFDPCAFPQLTDGVRCGIYFPHGQVCDPYSMMSVSELKLLGGVMEGFKKTKEDEDPAGNLQCRAFEFGIVFLERNSPAVESLARRLRSRVLPTARIRTAGHERFSRKQSYARLVRERSMQTGGDCDLLILVVKEPPQRAPDHVHRPQIFVSVGPLVAELFAYSNQGVFAEIANRNER
ncbi:hypothetical protein M3Y99_00789900 [Aphelenchoides fujianensis]|nr:hypothetical protein M3Y99_00789900 [Aphelenchoides fujianensis]